MRLPNAVLFFWSVFFSLFACGTVRASDMALVGAKIYPPPGETAIENGSILIRDGLIVQFPLAAVNSPIMLMRL